MLAVFVLQRVRASAEAVEEESEVLPKADGTTRRTPVVNSRAEHLHPKRVSNSEYSLCSSKSRCGARSTRWSKEAERTTSSPTMSLFGNLSSGGQQQKPSLFGAPTSTTAPSQPSGGLPGAATATTSAGGLFGNLSAPAASSSSSVPSLFAPTKPASLGSGLFGGSGATTTAASGSSSLFATASTPATGLLGGTTSQPAATGSSLFGKSGTASTGAAAPTAQASATSGLFGSTFLGSQQNQTGAQAQEASQTNGSKPVSSAHFDHLLERGRKRNSDFNGVPQSQFGELPSLQLGLGDIARKVQNMGGGSPSAGLARSRRGDTKAYVPL